MAGRSRTPPFDLLPKELRIVIWEATIEPRVIFLSCQGSQLFAIVYDLNAHSPFSIVGSQSHQSVSEVDGSLRITRLVVRHIFIRIQSSLQWHYVYVESHALSWHLAIKPVSIHLSEKIDLSPFLDIPWLPPEFLIERLLTFGLREIRRSVLGHQRAEMEPGHR